MKKATIAIDGEKLREALKRRDLSLGQASEELGFTRHALATMCARGRIAKNVAVALEAHYRIPLEAYKKPEKPRIMTPLERMTIERAYGEQIAGADHKEEWPEGAQLNDATVRQIEYAVYMGMRKALERAEKSPGAFDAAQDDRKDDM
ncbi:MAG: hypothetical protein IJ240_04150 [Clostridia bacterium]|nr:hypothetical protein [Clostridia bacterium]